MHLGGNLRAELFQPCFVISHVTGPLVSGCREGFADIIKRGVQAGEVQVFQARGSGRLRRGGTS